MSPFFRPPIMLTQRTFELNSSLVTTSHARLVCVIAGQNTNEPDKTS